MSDPVWPDSGPAPLSASLSAGNVVDVYLRDNTVLWGVTIDKVYAAPDDYVVVCRSPDFGVVEVRQHQVAYALQLGSMVVDVEPTENPDGLECVHCSAMGIVKVKPINRCRTCLNRYCMRHRYIHAHRPPDQMPV